MQHWQVLQHWLCCLLVQGCHRVRKRACKHETDMQSQRDVLQLKICLAIEHIAIIVAEASGSIKQERDPRLSQNNKQVTFLQLSPVDTLHIH
jgi:hypothetical protein